MAVYINMAKAVLPSARRTVRTSRRYRLPGQTVADITDKTLTSTGLQREDTSRQHQYVKWTAS